MYAEELLVHDGGKRERAERVHAGVIQAFRILSLTCARDSDQRVHHESKRADSHSSLKVK